MQHKILMVAAFSMLLASCGGGGGGGSDGNSATPPAAGGGTTTPPPAALQMSNLNLAQTHVLPPDGKNWTLNSTSVLNFHMVGGRPALAIADLSPADATNPRLEGRVGGQSLGDTLLMNNSDLPASEDNGPRFSDTAFSANIPDAWLVPGLEVRAVATGATPSAWQAVSVGADTDFLIRSIPFFLFGADQTIVPGDPAMPSPEALDELYAKWPMRTLDVVNPAGFEADWPELVVGPRNGGAAYVMSTAEDQRNGFDVISGVLQATGRLRLANGERNTAFQYYGAIVQARADGSITGPGGGLGVLGGHTGAGDSSYSGIFIHEQGHAFGLPHAGESFNAGGDYPYPGGSLDGSVWGYDQSQQLFKPTLVPSSARRFANCRSNTFDQGDARRVDDMGRCIRQDPMQSGSGDQASTDIYSIFADFNNARIQRYLEGETVVANDGSHEYIGGRVFESSSSPTGYQRWDTIDLDWVAVDPEDDPDNGRFGVDGGYPIERNVPVYSVVFTISNAGTAGATQIYPPIGPFNGNLMRSFDPTVASERQLMTPRQAPFNNYCRPRGCDYTLRVTYADLSQRHFAVQGGFRPFFQETTPPGRERTGPLDGRSYQVFAINIPATAAISRIELLDTPMVWQGFPLVPPVIASR